MHNAYQLNNTDILVSTECFHLHLTGDGGTGSETTTIQADYVASSDNPTHHLLFPNTDVLATCHQPLHAKTRTIKF